MSISKKKMLENEKFNREWALFQKQLALYTNKNIFIYLFIFIYYKWESYQNYNLFISTDKS